MSLAQKSFGLKRRMKFSIDSLMGEHDASSSDGSEIATANRTPPPAHQAKVSPSLLHSSASPEKTTLSASSSPQSSPPPASIPPSHHHLLQLPQRAPIMSQPGFMGRSPAALAAAAAAVSGPMMMDPAMYGLDGLSAAVVRNYSAAATATNFPMELGGSTPVGYSHLHHQFLNSHASRINPMLLNNIGMNSLYRDAGYHNAINPWFLSRHGMYKIFLNKLFTFIFLLHGYFASTPVEIRIVDH